MAERTDNITNEKEEKQYDDKGVMLDSLGRPYPERVSGPKRNARQRLYDRVDTIRLHLRGDSSIEIADWISDNRPYSITAGQIRYDLIKVRKEWVETYLTNYDELKAKELANIDELQRSYWEAWEESRKAKTTTEREKIEDTMTSKKGTTIPSYSRNKVKAIEKEEGGDPKYLVGIQWCIEQRCKILGFNAPRKYDINWRKEAKAAGVNPDELKENLVNQFVEAAKRGMTTVKKLTEE